MFLVQSTIADGRSFFTFINGMEARLTRTWVSIPDSHPNSLQFQGCPTMSYHYTPGTNYTAVKWTTSKVMLTKLRSDTYVHLGNNNGGNLYTEPVWIRSVQVILQDNPIYSASGFDGNFRPIISLDHIKPRPTVFRWTPGMLIQILPVAPVIPPPQPATKALTHDRDDSDNQGANPKRHRRNTAA